MLSFHSISLRGVVAVMLALATPLYGQVTGSLAAIVGYYRPVGHFDPASVYLTSLPERPSQLQGAAWGGAGHLSIGRRFGVSSEFSTAKSRIPEVITPGGTRGPTDATVFVATLEAQYDLSHSPNSYRVWINGGPGFVQHRGTAYSPLGSPTSLGGVLGVTLAVPIASHLQLTASTTALFYAFDVPMPPEGRLNPGSLEHGEQRDVLLHVGLAWGHL